MISIAVLLTCFNRKEKTISCLESLFKVKDEFVNSHSENDLLSLEVFLTDDGCTDGTADAVRNNFSNQSVNIIQGDGNLYWAGGMRLAWSKALNSNTNWDYFLLLNDDTDLLPNLFQELFYTRDFCLNKYGKEGIISGITSSKKNHNIITYGGDVWMDKLGARSRRIIPNGTPELVDVTNANILLVHSSVVKTIGIFYKGFRHGNADYDYANHARKAGFPVLLTGNICGRCDDDHENFDEYKNKILSMTLKERRKFFSNPLKSSADYLCFIRRNAIIRYPLVAFGRFLNLYFPMLYYRLRESR